MSDLNTINLNKLADRLKRSLGIVHKQDIQIANRLLELNNSAIAVGDDCAAIPDGDGYLLLATEGMWDVLVEEDPWFAGWCAVMVNVSDIAAMGGVAIAVVDTIWTENETLAEPLLAGMKAASQAFNVPIVGGHTNFRSAYNALGVSILGRAKKLISSFTAKPGDLLITAIDFAGEMHSKFPFWNAATKSEPHTLQQKLTVLPELAENNLCNAGKDISMGGIIGTLLMLIEASKCGAVLNLDSIIYPDSIDLETWLLCFPSYGYLLTISPNNWDEVSNKFAEAGITCSEIGKITPNHQLTLNSGTKSHMFWNLATDNIILDRN